MKNFIFLFLISVFFLSCSNRDTENSDDKTLVSKMTVKVFNSDNSYFTGSFNFSYNSDDSVKEIVEYVSASNNTNSETNVYKFGYSNNLVNTINLNNSEIPIIYNNNLISNFYNMPIEYYSTGELKRINNSDNYYVYSNENVSQIVSNTSITNIENDNKNNPFLNYTNNFKTVVDLLFNTYFSKIYFRTKNNVIKETIGSDEITHTILYNSNNYPESITVKDKNGNIKEIFNFIYQ